jgi:hypothetical protein
MDAVETTLRRIRGWFLVWFVLEAVAGTAAAAYVLEGMGRHALMRYATGGVGATGTIVSGIVVSLVLYLLAAIVLQALESRQPWARMVMLIIGWLTTGSAALGLLMLPGAADVFGPVVALSGADWPVLMAVNLLTKLGDLAYWGWVVYVLQTNAAVREAFLCRAPLQAGPGATRGART